MRDAIYQQLDRCATWSYFIVLVVLGGLCWLGFKWRAKALNERAGSKIITFDGRCAYTPQEAHDLLEMMGKRGRRFYALTQITLDLIYPLVYSSLFLIMIFRLYGGDPGYLLLVPVIALVADLLENFTNIYLALSHRQGSVPSLARFSSLCTWVKWSGVTISVILILVGIAVWLRHGR